MKMRAHKYIGKSGTDTDPKAVMESLILSIAF